MPGYRVRLPEKVHPISAGVKGGIAGGLVIPLPALIYGLVSGQGIWYPVNLLAGRSEEHTSELQSQSNLVCRLLLEKKNTMRCVMRERQILEPLMPSAIVKQLMAVFIQVSGDVSLCWRDHTVLFVSLASATFLSGFL